MERVEYCYEKNLELLLGSDHNEHHTVWGSWDVQQRGESPSEYIMAQRLLVQNKGKSPTFIMRVRLEVLDLTICIIGALKLIHGWRVPNEPSLSHHRCILYTIGTPQVLQKEHRNTKKTNWSKFRSELRDKLTYHWLRIEGKKDLETVAAMRDISLRD